MQVRVTTKIVPFDLFILTGVHQISASVKEMNNDEDAPCDVCRSKESEPSNEMVFCDVCDVCVHQACYGLKEIPKDSWYCKPCELNIRPKCIFCPSKKGAMKQTQEGEWAHVSCALWIPEVTFGDPETMENILYAHKIPKSRWNLICSLCPVKQKEGACIQCYVKSCKTAYHVTCAFANNLFMEMEDVESNEQEIKFESFCLEHSRIHASGQNPRTSKSIKKRKKVQGNLESIENKIATRVLQIKEPLGEENRASTSHCTGNLVASAAIKTSESNVKNVDGVSKIGARLVTDMNLASISKRTARKSFATPPPPKKIKGEKRNLPKGQSSNKQPSVHNKNSTDKEPKSSTLNTSAVHPTQFTPHERENNGTLSEHGSSFPNSSVDNRRNSSPNKQASCSVQKKQRPSWKKSTTTPIQLNSNSVNDSSPSNVQHFLPSSSSPQQSLSDIVHSTITNDDNLEDFSRYLKSLLRTLPFKKSLQIQKKIISLVVKEHGVCSEDESVLSSISSEDEE